MKNGVDIEIIIDEKFTSPRITIHTNEKNEQIERIVSSLQSLGEEEFEGITGKCGGIVSIISQKDIIRVHKEDRHVLVETDEGSYVVKYSISSLDEMLDEDRFFKISQSEIINLYRVKHFDVSLTGTVMVEFDNGDTTYVARRFVKPLKDKLGK
jgi:DNA-binding LytR/AlgR family response regulator